MNDAVALARIYIQMGDNKSADLVLDKAKQIIPAEDESILGSLLNVLKGDCSKAKETIGWMPEISFEDLVSIMVQYDIARINNDTRATYSVE